MSNTKNIDTRRNRVTVPLSDVDAKKLPTLPPRDPNMGFASDQFNRFDPAQPSFIVPDIEFDLDFASGEPFPTAAAVYDTDEKNEIATMMQAKAAAVLALKGNRPPEADPEIPAWAPIWATRAGIDGFGRWCAFDVGRDTHKVLPYNCRPDDGEELRWRENPRGSFVMGATQLDPEGRPDDVPARVIVFPYDLWIAESTITQGQWAAVQTKPAPCRFGGGTDWPRPAEMISVPDVMTFRKQLHSIWPYIVPRPLTEAEWEYAARAGTTGLRAHPDVDATSWYAENSGGETHPVGQKQPTPWGCFDMVGNVWVWVIDRARTYLPDDNTPHRAHFYIPPEYAEILPRKYISAEVAQKLAQPIIDRFGDFPHRHLARVKVAEDDAQTKKRVAIIERACGCNHDTEIPGK